MKKRFALLLVIATIFACTACDEPAEHIHDYTSTVTKEASCLEVGTRTFTCSCSDSYTEIIALTEHNWSSWQLDTPAFIDQPGTDKRTCSVCSTSESRDRTVNAIGNSFYDGGLQYIILDNGNITADSILNYACHVLHDYIYEETPSAIIINELYERFTLPNEFANDIIEAGKATVGFGMYGYDTAKDTFTLEYQAESGEFFLKGYVHNSGDLYTAYFGYSDFGFEVMPETIWKVELEFRRANGKANKYLSITQVDALPDNLIECPIDEQGDFPD